MMRSTGFYRQIFFVLFLFDLCYIFHGKLSLNNSMEINQKKTLFQIFFTRYFFGPVKFVDDLCDIHTLAHTHTRTRTRSHMDIGHW